MYARTLELPARSFFLFGPRGTGKTTWLRTVLPPARSHWFDLVVDRELVRLTRDPERFTQEVEALPPGSWVVVDEVQKMPSLLAKSAASGHAIGQKFGTAAEPERGRCALVARR